ncbi:MAG: cation transporter [Actinomycetaceae bacterium]|nr:cation transporter [Actinomycetaceae bacterium]
MITLKVTGLTCGHCVNAVTDELTDLAGVESVQVDLNPGENATSTVEVTTSGEVSDDALRDAIAEAGYELTSIER